MMLKTILFLLYSYLLVGCVRNTQKQIVYENVNNVVIEGESDLGDVDSDIDSHRKNIEKTRSSVVNNKQIDITYKGKDLTRIVKDTDIFKDIHYVPLETNDVALLGDFPKNIICKNSYIYVFDTKMSRPELYLYNQEGKYQHYIGKKGQGPEEYLGGMHVAVNHQGVVSVFDRINSAIINYTTGNKFLSRIKMDSVSMYNGIYLTDSLLLVKSWHDRPGNKFHIVDIVGKKVVNTFSPIVNRIYRIGFPEMMTSYEGKILLSEYQSNEILELTEEGAKIRYVVNVNDKMPPEGFWEQKASSYSMIADKERQMNYIGHIPCFAESNRSIFLGFWGSLDKDESQGWAFIDKSSGKYQTFKRIMLAENVVIEPNFFYSQNDGRVVFAISPETILNSGNQEFISQFPGLKEDDNPILMFAEIK